MSEQCEDQLGVPIDDDATFYIYCLQQKNHTGNHYWSGQDREGRKIWIRWQNPIKNNPVEEQKGEK